VLERLFLVLGEQIKPYTHKILSIVQRSLNDEDYLTWIESWELISNLSKTVGLSNMILAIRSDLDNPKNEIW